MLASYPHWWLCSSPHQHGAVAQSRSATGLIRVEQAARGRPRLPGVGRRYTCTPHGRGAAAARCGTPRTPDASAQRRRPSAALRRDEPLTLVDGLIRSRDKTPARAVHKLIAIPNGAEFSPDI
jgi:hypothetical protein